MERPAKKLRINPWAAVLAAALVAVLGWFAFHEHRQASGLVTATAKLREARDRDAVELTTLRLKNAALQKEKDALVAGAVAAAKIPAHPGSADKAAMSRSVDLTEYVEADPEYPAYRDKILLERVRARYGDLSFLKLPPDKLKALQRLLVDQVSAPQDAQAAAAKMGFGLGSPEVGKAIGDAMREIDGEIKDLVGKTGFADLQNAQRQAQNVSYVQTNLGLKLTLAGQPFSGEQITAVSDTLNQFQRGSVMTMLALPP
ncbi:MAG: hypothetical protein JWM35_1936, partial [Verrucomicrobia bacterium]|nr:hypothetical protein [Verrucomicrobiota bacterium]